MVQRNSDRDLDTERILVLGAAGMVGHKMWQTLRSQFPNVLATIRKPRETYADDRVFAGYLSGEPEAHRLIDRVELREPDGIFPVLSGLRPTVIVNCAGLTFRRQNSESVEDNIRLNALLPHILNRWCEENSARLIAFSTDCVFSGASGRYTEEFTPDATDVYGRTKALGEVRSARALILRTSVIGHEIEHRTQLVEWFLKQSRLHEPISGYTRAIFSGVTTLFLSQLVAKIIRAQTSSPSFPRSGLFNVASEPVSKFDLLHKLIALYGLSVELRPCETKVTRKDLDGTRFERATGFRVPPWDEMLEQMRLDALTSYSGGS